MTEIRAHVDLIWGIAELLRGDYKRSDYGKVILPLVLMRRLDQALDGSRDAVLKRAAQLEQMGADEGGAEMALRSASKLPFFNRSKVTFPGVLDDSTNVAQMLRGHIDGYSRLAREAIDEFDFDRQIDKLDQSDLLFQVIGRVCSVDLHPDKVSNLEMGYIFEELIRRFAEASNETAGEHFTPREVVRLMVNLLLDGEDKALSEKGVIRTVFDPACGTGGMLSEADAHIRELNPSATVLLSGQELNSESYAICLSDMLVKSKDPEIVHGNSLSNDGFAGKRFHYGIANPPFGVDWTKVEKAVREEHDFEGFDGRFGPGLPRKSDGQLLFLLHLVSKMRPPEEGGGRVAIVHNGSPLFTGAAGSGESEIRRWLLENDLIEAIVALPEQLFYNTGIASYVWLLSNRKSPEREGIVQLIDAREHWTKMKKSLGEKRRYLTPEQIAEITVLHGAFEEGEKVKLVPVDYFGYRTITVERPLRAKWVLDATQWAELPEAKAIAKLTDEQREQVRGVIAGLGEGEIAGGEAELRNLVKAGLEDAELKKPPAALVKALVAHCRIRDPELEAARDSKGNLVADAELRDSENVPLTEDVADYLDRDVLPYVPDAWAPDPEGKVGYEIPFTRLFYKYVPPRPSEEIKAELSEREARIRELLEKVLV